ncbi:uncharacterized protein LOC114934844 [Nylanderia fulva]|uniref:uncharacterized protein LOC114934844 n=1 Tax=Nylanderia fulva TaxID=613905 RepID=UPI0010FB2E04|nr:uncharacterized protein LOC114934844 [Nylanderia fulva]
MQHSIRRYEFRSTSVDIDHLRESGGEELPDEDLPWSMLWSASSSAWKRTPPMEDDSRLIFSRFSDDDRSKEGPPGPRYWRVFALLPLDEPIPASECLEETRGLTHTGPREKPPAMGRRTSLSPGGEHGVLVPPGMLPMDQAAEKRILTLRR